MNKAFIFDMDGVLIDTERAWDGHEKGILVASFGRNVAEKIGDTVGVSINAIYEKATALGADADYDEYRQRYDEGARTVFARAMITPGVDRLVEKVLTLDFRLGLVSSSPRTWINYVLARLPFADQIEHIVSINDNPDLKSKPAPDGYLAAFKQLGANPRRSVVLEDSNPGIMSGKSAETYVIGFRGNLLPGYEQTGADAYADTMDDVCRLVEKFDVRGESEVVD
ncbi:MAG: HAD family phosphatase [bacterium]|nr:HAD family phosphatase [bacterium]